jgi:N-dimethylarginine dimethylaminohydrolase
MGRTLEARIKRAAHKVLRRERELGVAQEQYQELLEEARQHGVEVPRTALTNPLMPRRRADR